MTFSSKSKDKAVNCKPFIRRSTHEQQAHYYNVTRLAVIEGGPPANACI